MRHPYMAYDEADETVAYCGSRLSELLAVQSETRLVTAAAIETIESTVVLAGSSRRPPAFIEWDTTGVSWRSTGPMAYSLSEPVAPVAVADRRRGVTRPVGALLAGVGLLIGLFVTPAMLPEMTRSERALATQVQPRQVQPREPAVETTPLVSPAHQKLATKRSLKAVGIAIHAGPHVAAASAASAASAARPLANERGDDTKTSTDLKLLLAAQADRTP